MRYNKIMKLHLWVALFVLCLSPLQVLGAQKVIIPQRGAPGLKMSYNNTALIESTVRQKISTKADTEEVIIKLKCYKRWKVRGRSKTKAYQCDPIEIEADVPGEDGEGLLPE